MQSTPLTDGQRLSLSLPLFLSMFAVGVALFVSQVGGPADPEQANLLRLIFGSYAALCVLAFGANLVLLAVLAYRDGNWRFGQGPVVTRRFAGLQLLSMSALWLSTYALYASWG